VLGDPDDPAVVEHQLEACDRWAQAMGITLRPEERIAEVGSGESIDARPRFAADLMMLEESPPPGGGYYFTTEVARLTRAEMEEVGRIIRVFRNAKVKPVIAGRAFDLSVPDDELFFTHLAVYARHEVARFKWRVEMEMTKQLREGKVRLGAKPWGYIWDKNAERLLPHPERFPILVACCQEIFTTGIRQLSLKYGVPASTLSTVLSNPTICGWPSVHWGPDPKHPGRYRRLPRDQWRWCGQQNDTYPHACTRAEFDRIQQVMAERKKLGIRTVGVGGWCRDVVEFEAHPGRVRLSTCRVGAGTYGYPVYERREGDRRVAFIEREPVHAAALTTIRELFSDPVHLLKSLTELQRSEEEARVAAKGPDVASQLAEARRRYQEAVDAEYDESDRLLREALTERRVRLGEEIRRLEGQLERERRQFTPSVDLGELIRFAPWLGSAVEERWEEISEEQRRLLVGGCIRRIVVRLQRGPKGKITRREVVLVELQPWFSTHGCSY